MYYPTAVYMDKKIFISHRYFYSRYLYVFHIVTRTWSKVYFPECCDIEGFTMASTNNQVHTLGGWYRKDGNVERNK